MGADSQGGTVAGSAGERSPAHDRGRIRALGGKCQTAKLLQNVPKMRLRKSTHGSIVFRKGSQGCVLRSIRGNSIGYKRGVGVFRAIGTLIGT